MHIIFHLVGIGVVNACVVGNLIVDAIGPVVVGHIGVAGIIVAIDIEGAPFVPHHIPFVGFSGAVLGIGGGADADFGNATLGGCG